jgi:putative ATPase
MKDLGYHEGYQYAHAVPEAYIPQEYLPEELRGSVFYEPGPFGFEKEVAKRLAWWADLKQKVSGQPSPQGDKSQPTSDRPGAKSTDEEE